MKYSRTKILNNLRNKPDKKIDTSDIKDLDNNFWKGIKLVKPRKKEVISIRLDPDIIEWYKKQGKGYLTLMNKVLTKYREAHR